MNSNRPLGMTMDDVREVRTSVRMRLGACGAGILPGSTGRRPLRMIVEPQDSSADLPAFLIDRTEAGLRSSMLRGPSVACGDSDRVFATAAEVIHDIHRQVGPLMHDTPETTGTAVAKATARPVSVPKGSARTRAPVPEMTAFEKARLILDDISRVLLEGRPAPKRGHRR